MSATRPTLFDLLPAIYRIRDAQLAQNQNFLTSAENGQLKSLQNAPSPLSPDQQVLLDQLTAKAARGPLQSLLRLIEEQVGVVANDLDQLYDNQFIETCAPWVIPYIGDLIGYQSIYGEAPSVSSPRAEVANTIAFRRRKGTILVLEQLARDVTGWGAHAVEFFQVCADTQYVKHVRPRNFYAPDVRHLQPQAFRDDGFSRVPRKIDVHNPASPGLPRYHVPNIGIFLWSLGAYSVTKATPVPATATGSATCYRLNPLGMDMPLFHTAISQGGQIVAAARPVNVPDRLHRRALCADMQKGAGSSYYGEGASLALYVNHQLLYAWQVQVADLSGNDGSWHNAPTANYPYAALVDPELGRVALPPPASGTVPVLTSASFFYGFNAAMGGGEYDRETSFIVTDAADVFFLPDEASSPRYQDLAGAVTYITSLLSPSGQLAETLTVALEISTSATINLSEPLVDQLVVDLPAGATFELRAANGARPTLLLAGELLISGGLDSTFILNGFLIAASATMTPGSPPAALLHVPAARPAPVGGPNLLEELILTHCTLLPGRSVTTGGEPTQICTPVLIAEPPVEVVAQCSILGAIRASIEATVSLSDSIVDATSQSGIAYADLTGSGGGGALTLQGCTVVGQVHAALLSLVSNSIFWGSPGLPSALVADQKQAGCVRFSYLPVNAVTPRRYECVEQAVAAPQPLFISLRYGHPGYLKLLAGTDDAIRRGADDGGEMGAFHFVLAPQRESDLATRLQEYVPVGLATGLIYET